MIKWFGFRLKYIVGKMTGKQQKQMYQIPMLLTKGPFIYYVSTFFGFFDPPPPLRKHVFSTKNKQKLAFSDPPPPPLQVLT